MAFGKKEKMKFMMTLDERISLELKALCELYGVTIQELVRARIIPEWMMLKKKQNYRQEVP